MWVIVAFLIGCVVGGILSKVIFKPEIAGAIRVDHSDPDSGPYLFLELQKGVGSSIMQKNYVTFKVEVKDYISHK
jgi:hypothetical protein